MQPAAHTSPTNAPISPGGEAASPPLPSASESAASSPELTHRQAGVVSAAAGIGFALLGIFFIAYGTYRVRAVKTALERKTFSHPSAQILTLLGAKLEIGADQSHELMVRHRLRLLGELVESGVAERASALLFDRGVDVGVEEVGGHVASGG